MTSAVLKRVVRRETHSPRTVATVIVLVLVAVAAIYVGVEIVLHLLGVGPFLVAPGAALTWLQELPDQHQGLVVAGGLIAVVAGVVLVWLALGARPKAEASAGILLVCGARGQRSDRVVGRGAGAA